MKIKHTDAVMTATCEELVALVFEDERGSLVGDALNGAPCDLDAHALWLDTGVVTPGAAFEDALFS